MFVAVVVVIAMVASAVYLLLPDRRLTTLMVNIPAPRWFPLLGNVPILKTGHEFYKQMMEWSSTFSSQGVYAIWIGSKPLCVISKPEYVEALIGGTTHIQKSEEYDLFYPWLGTGLLTSTGDKWKSRRRMLTPTFHFNILHDFVHVFNHQSRVLVDKLKVKADKGRFDVFPDVTHCALDIICETAMGQSVDAQSKESDYVEAVHRMSYFIDHRSRSPWFKNDTFYNWFGDGKEMSQKLNILHKFTKSVIVDRLKNFDQKRADLIDKELKGESTSDVTVDGKRKNLAFLDMLLYMSDNLTKLSMEDIREEVDTFMFEGHDTTAAAMTWAIHLLGANPDAQTQLHEELDSVFGDDEREATMEDLKQLKYLECCIKESLRLFPSVFFFGRKVAEDLKLDHYTLPKGISATVHVSGIHYNPEIYPEPEAFRPERFHLEVSKHRHPYSYIPFSAGSRNCIGQKFALLEEKTVLSHIFRNFSIKSLQRRSEVREVAELILRPEKGLFIELTPRRR